MSISEGGVQLNIIICSLIFPEILRSKASWRVATAKYLIPIEERYLAMFTAPKP